jgi:hypothetical protein
MMQNQFKRISAITLLLMITSAVLADDKESGFLADYSKLKTVSENGLTRYYLAPDAQKKLAHYDKIMVDQPEIFLSDDSPYQGLKPAKLAVIAEVFREQVSSALSSDYTVVEEAGPDTLYLKLALTDLMISKNRTKILEFTPAGLVYQAGRNAVQSDYKNAVRQVSLVDLKIEGELLDSQTSDLLGEFVNDHGTSTTPQDWTELLTDMQHFGQVIQCQIRNAGSLPDKRVDCHVEAPDNNQTKTDIAR